MSHEVSWRYNDMFDWDPEAPRVARQCEDNFNLSKYRWTLIAPEEEARFRPDRRFTRVQKRKTVTNDHDPHAEPLPFVFTVRLTAQER